MGHRDAMSPEHYGAVRGATAPFPAAPPSKWRPFNNSVIFQPICFKFKYKVDPRIGNVATLPQRYGAVRGAAASFPAAAQNGAHSITLSFFGRFASNLGRR